MTREEEMLEISKRSDEGWMPHGRPEFFIPEEHPELATLMAIPFIPFVVIWFGIAYVSTKLKELW